MIVSKITFPKFTGAKCSMMPFIQGDPDSLPTPYRQYGDIIESQFIERGEVGFLTIDESFVHRGKSQRGYNSAGAKRNVHIEVGHVDGLNCWGGGGGGWGGSPRTLLEDSTQVLVANSISGTCRVWDAIERGYTPDGDLSAYLDRYPEEAGIDLMAGEVAKISIFTPHECVPQAFDSERQFLRIVGKGVRGRESYFTKNPLVEALAI